MESNIFGLKLFLYCNILILRLNFYDNLIFYTYLTFKKYFLLLSIPIRLNWEEKTKRLKEMPFSIELDTFKKTIEIFSHSKFLHFYTFFDFFYFDLYLNLIISKRLWNKSFLEIHNKVCFYLKTIEILLHCSNLLQLKTHEFYWKPPKLNCQTTIYFWVTTSLCLTERWVIKFFIIFWILEHRIVINWKWKVCV